MGVPRLKPPPIVFLSRLQGPRIGSIRDRHPYNRFCRTGVSVIGETWIDDDGDGVCDPGDGIEYVMLVRNAGTVTLSDLRLSDDLLGDRADCDTPEGGSLEPNAGMTCMGTYQVWLYNGSMMMRIEG